MPTAKNVTIGDIAKRTGLSAATISLILNNRQSGSFLPETVERVHAAAAELGYVRRRYTRGEPQRKRRVAIICPSVMNPYYAILLQGMEQVLRSSHFGSCIFTTYWDSEVEREVLDSLDRDHFAGVIYAMIPTVEEATTRFASELPMVLVGDRHSNLTVDMAEINNYNGGRLIARHLIELGHKQIAYLSPTLDSAHSARVMRLNGIRDTYAELCPEGSVLVREMKVHPTEELETTGIEHRVGYELARACLEEEQPITAFAAINDMVAYGIMTALHEAGKRIPQDYSVSGFDNIYPSRFGGIQLTSVEHSIEKKGRWAARLLIDKLSHTDDSRAAGGLMRVEYESFLVKGKTTAPPTKR